MQPQYRIVAAKAVTYPCPGFITGTIRDIAAGLSFWEIVACELGTYAVAFVAVLVYELFLARYLERHKRKWDFTAVLVTFPTLLLIYGGSQYVVLEPFLGEALGLWWVIGSCALIWLADRLAWLEKLMNKPGEQVARATKLAHEFVTGIKTRD